MEKLGLCFERLGFNHVSTYINSGNVIFDTPMKSEKAIVDKIEKAIKSTFGFPVRVVVRTKKNITTVAKEIPDSWQNDKTQKSDVLFLWDAYADKDSLKLIDSKEGVDNLQYVEGAILWNVDRKKYGKSGMSTFVGTELYKNMTVRNVNTVRKLVSLMSV